MQYHLDQAQENLEFLSKLENFFPNDHFDWKTIVIFYIAVHWTRAVLAKRSIAVLTHSDAKIFLKKILSRGAYSNYVEIENYADISRYNGIRPNRAVWLANRQSDYLSSKDLLFKLQHQLRTHIPNM